MWVLRFLGTEFMTKADFSPSRSRVLEQVKIEPKRS